MFMMAISLFDNRNEVVLPADEIIRRVDNRAEYYSTHEGYSYYFVPTEENETSNIWCYSINGKKYTSVGTNDYKGLEKFFEGIDRERKAKIVEEKPKQMSLFEQCE